MNRQPSRESFLGRWLAGGSSPVLPVAPSSQTNSLTGHEEDGEEREMLVDKLKEELGQYKEHFHLTAHQVRLLLNLPEESRSAPVPSFSNNLERTETIVRTARDFVPPPPAGFIPPPVDVLPETSKVFGSWDLKSSENLDPDEIQAIMLALTAAEDHTSTSDKKNQRPAPLNLRMASVQRMPSSEDTDMDEFLVTFGDEDLPPPPPFQLNQEEELRLSGGGSKPALASRQYSIQPFPTSEEEPVVERPSCLQTRQASVQPLPRNQTTGGTSFMVSMPASTKIPPVSAGISLPRQVSCQRTKSDEKPTFKMNGQKVSFQVEAVPSFSTDSEEIRSVPETAPTPSFSNISEEPIEATFRTAADFMPPPPCPNNFIPPPVDALPETSKVFDSWDLQSSGDLDPNEIQAIMLALMAAEDPTPTTDKSIRQRPAPLSQRMASVQRMPSSEDPSMDDFLVTFAEEDLPPPPPLKLVQEEEEMRMSGNSPPFAPLKPIQDEEEMRMGGGASKPALASRRYSIQPFPTSEEELVLERPSFLQTRQASVQPLPRDQNAGRASFMVSLPASTKCPAVGRGTRGIPQTRRVSCQLAKTDEEKPTFRMNGQKVSFQVEAIA